MLRKLVIGLSASVSVLSVFAGAALAQGASGSAPPVENVVVTGTHIAGVASTGSTVTTITPDDIKNFAATDAYDAVEQMPQVLNINSSTNNFGGARPGGQPSNQGLADSISLRGVGKTLTLFNGQRVAGTGSGNIPEIDVIPSNMLQRIDVQADGASAIYGSDALTGTVNLIMRQPEDIVQFSGQDTFKRGDSSWYAAALAGHTWSGFGRLLGEGGIIVAYQHTVTGATSAKDLSYAYSDNLVPYEGAAGAFPITSSPGNVQGLGSNAAAQALTYPIPPTGIGPTGQLTLAQLGSSSSPNTTSLYKNLTAVLPEIRQDALAINAKQDIGSFVHAFVFGYAYRSQGFQDYGTTPQATTTISVPNTNPYSPCATAAAAASAGLPPPSQVNSQGLTCPANGTIKVPYSFTNETGPEQRVFTDRAYMFTVGADVDLPFGWTGRVSESASYDNVQSAQINQINSTALAQVISGVNKPSIIPFFNPFCSDQNGPCNSAATNNYLSSYKSGFDPNRLWDFNVGAQGPTIDLPAGPIRLAVGYEYQIQTQLVGAYATTLAAVGVPQLSNYAQEHRYSPQAYGEAYIPVISPEMDIPFVESLNFDAAIRYAAYTLPNVQTTNPKFGITYQPIHDIKIRGSYGTSFLAPTGDQSNPFSSANIVNSGNSYTCGTFSGINLAACPQGANTPVNAFYTAGGNNRLLPETGKAWTLGADFTPSFIPGLTASVTYYKLVFANRFSSPGSSGFPGSQASASYIAPFVAFNPTYFPTRAVVSPYVQSFLPSLTLGAPLTQAQFNQFQAQIFATPQYALGVPPTLPVALIGDGRNDNSGTQKTDGFDFNSTYFFDTDYGTAHVGVTGTLVTSFDDQPVTGGPVFNRENQFGFDLRLHGRLEAGLSKDGLSGTVYMNYTNPYSADPQYVPPAALALNPGFTHIAGNITWDLAVSYDTGNQFAEYYGDNMRFQLVIKNALDKKPPFFLNASTQPAILYDSGFGNPLGREISIGITKTLD